jgi:hypothetical protein
MKRFLGLIIGLLFIGGLTAAGAAPGPPGDGSHPRDNRDRSCENTEGEEDRPDFCDDEGDPGEEPEPADCPPADGPISGGLQQVSDGMADGGAPPELTDGIDTLNCEAIVAIEEGAGL